MANDPKAPERIWATVNGMSTRLPDMARMMIGGWSEDKDRPHAVEYVRADLCPSPLPPPGSEGEAEMVEQVIKANFGDDWHEDRDMRRAMPGLRADIVRVLDMFRRAALAPASGEANRRTLTPGEGGRDEPEAAD